MKGIIKFILLGLALTLVLAQEASTNKETEDVKKSYSAMIAKMSVEESNTMNDMLLKQIYIWLGIGLALVLYFSVMAMVDMPIQKSSILYAKYGTSRAQQEIH